MGRPSDKPDEQQRDTAALWHARISGGDLSPSQRAEFEHWLASDTVNRLAWDEQRVLWARLEQPAQHLAVEYPPQPSRRTRLWARGGLAGAVTVACAWLWLVHPHLLQNLQADFVTGTEVVRKVDLPDGTVAWLGADTAIDVDYDNSRRHLRLLRGTAFFDVTPRSTPPFTVDAGEGEVRVVGTRFNLARQGEMLTVAVERGRVEVRGQADIAPQILDLAQRLEVFAGLAGQVQDADVAADLAWMSGRIEVQQVRVGELVAEIARHMPGRVIVRDSVANMRISGTFPLDDPQGSLQTIIAATGASVFSGSGWLTVLY